MEYSEKEIGILQKFLDVYRDIPECPIVGMGLRFQDPEEKLTCRGLSNKGLFRIEHYEGDPKDSITAVTNEECAKEMVQLFKAGVLKKFEEQKAKFREWLLSQLEELTPADQNFLRLIGKDKEAAVKMLAGNIPDLEKQATAELGFNMVSVHPSEAKDLIQAIKDKFAEEIATLQTQQWVI
jgi:hypothetical protein